MKFIPLLVCALVALALPACSTTGKDGCKVSSCCAAKTSKHK